MKNKVILYSGTIILTLILFGVSTYMQKKMINYEPKIECLFVKQDIIKNQKIEEEMLRESEALHFEKAKELKDLLDYINITLTKQKVEFNKI